MMMTTTNTAHVVYYELYLSLCVFVCVYTCINQSMEPFDRRLTISQQHNISDRHCIGCLFMCYFCQTKLEKKSSLHHPTVMTIAHLTTYLCFGKSPCRFDPSSSLAGCFSSLVSNQVKCQPISIEKSNRKQARGGGDRQPCVIYNSPICCLPRSRLAPSFLALFQNC